MKLRMWMMDVAREQSPSYESLRAWCRLSLDAGYNAMGLYLEHRFAYPSLPWAHGKGTLEPSVVAALQSEFPDLQLIPFINLLGHFEGFLYTEQGARFAEETFRGMQANPLHPEFGALCRTIIDDTLAAFSSEIVHIGGDETWQLGVGEASAARVREAERSGAPDGKAVLYGEHFGPLAQYVIDRGRRPGVWGDMFDEHPDALELIPRETLIFDWRYFSGPRPPEGAHEKVYCPAIHTYNALWCHLPQSERNVVEHAAAAESDGAYGVCVTTWECGLFGNYNTLKPAIRASGGILRDTEERFAEIVKPAGFSYMAAVDWLEARNARFRLQEDLLAPYRTPGDAADDIEVAVNDPGDRPAEGSIARLADDAIALLLRSGQTRGVFRVREDAATFETVPAEDRVMTIPLELADDLFGRLRDLAALTALAAEEGAGSIRGLAKGEPFEIALRSTGGPAARIELEVLTSPPLDAEAPDGLRRDVAVYARSKDAPRFLREYLRESETSEEWARLLGCELQEAGGLFAFGNIRSAIKARLLLFSNPFLLYVRNGDDLFSPSGEKALEILDRAAHFATGPDERGPVQLGIKALEFIRQCRRSHLAYAEGKVGEAMNHLAPCRQIFEDLEKIAVASSINADGSLADVERCRAARRHIDLVIGRMKLYGDGSLGYLPSFATLTH